MARRRGKGGGLLIVAALVLAGCGYGVTGGVTQVHDLGATLHGTADRTEPGWIDWWFEYGLTEAYGERSGFGRNYVVGPIEVSRVIDGLTPDTTYHYRLCVYDGEDGHGVCGADRTFTSDSPRDHVDGILGVLFPQRYEYQIHLSSDPDGSDVIGDLTFLYQDPSTFPPTFRSIEAEVTCLRIVGNRAAIGFLADGDGWILYAFDGGASADSFQYASLADPTTCPEPPPGPYGTVATVGNLRITDLP